MSSKGIPAREILLCILVFVFAIAAMVFIGLYFVEYGKDEAKSEGSKLVDDGGMDPEAQGNVCTTDACVHVASNLLNNMDLTADPCEDFYEFTCGNYVERTVIPEAGITGTFYEINDNIILQVRLMLEKTYENLPPLLEDTTTVYKSCVDTDKLDELGIQPALDMLNEYGGWPVLDENWDENSFNLEETLSKVRRDGYSLFINPYVSADFRDPTISSLYLSQPSLGLSRDYFMDERNSTVMTAYENLAVKLATLMGADPDKAKQDMKEVVDWEVQYAQIHLTNAQRRELNYDALTINELSINITDDIDWVTYFNTVFSNTGKTFTGEETVLVRHLDYYKRFAPMYPTLNKRIAANYIMLRLLRAFTDSMPKEFRVASNEYIQALTGRTEEDPRWKSCATYVSAVLQWTVGKLYVQEYYNTESKQVTDEMITYLRKAFSEMLKRYDWLEQSEKDYAQSKLEKMGEKVGYPDYILDDVFVQSLYPNLNIVAEEYFKNRKAITLSGTTFSLNKYGKKVNKDEWFIGPAIFNAFYDPQNNEIVFPAGFFQEPIFSSQYPKYINFGASGMVIGHEITHGFDDQGRKFGDNGAFENWWSEQTIEKFSNLTSCMRDQYSNYVMKSVNSNVDGQLTLGENIADNGGMIEAYEAYKMWVADNGNIQEPKLPGIDLTPDQLFFANYAQVWCGKAKMQYELLLLRADTHAPGIYRVIGPMQNNEEFSKAYQCKKGSYMNPDHKCRVW